MAKGAGPVKQGSGKLAFVKKPDPEREKRLAEALRANLRKRKQQHATPPPRSDRPAPSDGPGS